MSTAVTDLRGRMYRERRLMPPQETTEFLRRQKVANVGTMDTNGRPYVVPLVYIYEGGDLLYLHTVGASGAQAMPAAALFIADRFWRCLPYGTLAPGTVCLEFRMFCPG